MPLCSECRSQADIQRVGPEPHPLFVALATLFKRRRKVADKEPERCDECDRCGRPPDTGGEADGR